jgi:2-polyprenyl-6-methoxyphenol hydroxylase-like FAD-dependent oxidoreductase
MAETSYRMGRAVVIGASLAGLLAARVLSKHFEQVTVLDRDTLPEAPEANDGRRGVPHGRHVHVLLIRGQEAMEDLLPGLVPALIARGATRLNTGKDLAWHHFGCWKARFDSDLHGISVSRPLLEQEVRRRVSQLQNVFVVGGAVFTRYAMDWEHSRITGVFVRARGAEMPEELVRADLVVDATGRGSQTPRLLKELGYFAPPESLTRMNLAYASRIYERPAGNRDWQAMIVAERPPNTRGGLIFPIEGDRWLVTLVGAHGDHPPTSPDGFLEFARSLPVPDVHEAICGARPLTDAQGFGFPATWRRRYEQLKRFPAGLLVMGDALCSFNPVYGQGMTTTALEARVLDKCLSRLVSRGMLGIQALTEDFRRRAAEVVEVPWQLASAEDLRFPQTAGLRPAGVRLLHWYTAKVHEAAGRSPLIARKFISIVHMVAPPSGLFGWEVIRELLRVARCKRSAGFESVALAPESPYG